MNYKIEEYLKQHFIHKNDTYVFSKDEIETIIGIININNKSLNLFNISIENLESFINTCSKELKENEKGIVLETGEFGLLLFNKLIEKYCEEKQFEIKEVSFRVKDLSTSGGQYINYETANGYNIRVEHNYNLDKNTNFNSEETGFPITSQTLFFKKTY